MRGSGLRTATDLLRKVVWVRVLLARAAPEAAFGAPQVVSTAVALRLFLLQPEVGHQLGVDVGLGLPAVVLGGVARPPDQEAALALPLDRLDLSSM